MKKSANEVWDSLGPLDREKIMNEVNHIKQTGKTTEEFNRWFASQVFTPSQKRLIANMIYLCKREYQKIKERNNRNE